MTAVIVMHSMSCMSTAKGMSGRTRAEVVNHASNSLHKSNYSIATEFLVIFLYCATNSMHHSQGYHGTLEIIINS